MTTDELMNIAKGSLAQSQPQKLEKDPAQNVPQDNKENVNQETLALTQNDAVNTDVEKEKTSHAEAQEKTPELEGVSTESQNNSKSGQEKGQVQESNVGSANNNSGKVVEPVASFTDGYQDNPEWDKFFHATISNGEPFFTSGAIPSKKILLDSVNRVLANIPSSRQGDGGLSKKTQFLQEVCRIFKLPTETFNPKEQTKFMSKFAEFLDDDLDSVPNTQVNGMTSLSGLDVDKLRGLPLAAKKKLQDLINGQFDNLSFVDKDKLAQDRAEIQKAFDAASDSQKKEELRQQKNKNLATKVDGVPDQNNVILEE